jgi:hypothetical protein
MMRKSAYLLAILVAAVSTAAVAKDLKQGKKSTAPTVTASQLTDAEMDRVTAGLYFVNNDQTVANPGQGNLPGCYCASGIGRFYGTPAVDTAQGARLSP